jgi:hypothetical protein
VEREDQSRWVTWALALVVPLLAGGAGWLLEAATTSPQECSTGGNGSAVGSLAFLALVLAGPAAVVCRTRHVRPFLPAAVAPAMISFALALPLVFIGGSIWWSAHDCMT